MFRGTSPSLPLPRVTVYHHVSDGLYIAFELRSRDSVSAVSFLSLCIGNVKFIGDFVLHSGGSALCPLTER